MTVQMFHSELADLANLFYILIHIIFIFLYFVLYLTYTWLLFDFEKIPELKLSMEVNKNMRQFGVAHEI